MCSPSKERFKWISTSAEKLHVQMIGKHLVRGGIEYNDSPTNIGRILHKGEVVVARVCSSQAGDAKLHYLDDNTQKTTDAYEVLIYE